MRGRVLAGPCSWEVGPRTVEDYKEAARCYHRAATLAPDREQKRGCIEKAVEINQFLANM